jgi:HAD superfamily hydrolase (TIGR01458 family)
MYPSRADIKGLLLDLDGVFYVDNEPLPGAIETIQFLQAQCLPCCYLTNTTTQSRQTLYQKLLALGLPIALSEIVSAPYAAVLYLRQLGSPTCSLILNEDVKTDFAEFPQSDQQPNVVPDVVVVGDIGDRWNYGLLNQMFGYVMQGAQLIALHKNKYWQGKEGLRLDIGALITGLEYATGTPATVIGKPAPAFFTMALSALGLNASEVVMVGDDIESDIDGAQQMGIAGLLIKTGKYRPASVERSGIQPHATLETITDLKQWLTTS